MGASGMIADWNAVGCTLGQYLSNPRLFDAIRVECIKGRIVGKSADRLIASRWQ